MQEGGIVTALYPQLRPTSSTMSNPVHYPSQQQSQQQEDKQQYQQDQQHEQQQPLRRAVYVRVADLTSVYNIDQNRLKEELERVNANQKLKATEEDSLEMKFAVPTELDTSISQKRLQPPRSGFNLCVLVGNVQLVVDKFRVDGTKVRLAEVEVGDETGIVSLRARDEQIDLLRSVSESSGAVVLRNCTLELFQGKHIRLAVTKWGKLSAYPDNVASTPPPPSKMNKECNFSLVDLSSITNDSTSYNNDPYMVGDENQGSPMRGHNPVYGGGRGRGRRPMQNKQTHGLVHPIPHYGGSVPYTGGLQGYGFNNMGTAPNYHHSQHQTPYSHLNNQHRSPMMIQPPSLYNMQQQQQNLQLTQQQQQQALQSMHHMYHLDQLTASPLVSGIPGSYAVPLGMHSSVATIENSPSRSDSPSSRMNPQAETFDPSFGIRGSR